MRGIVQIFPGVSLGVAAMIYGCTGSPSGTSVSVRDSAGVEIVEHSSGSDEQAAVWRIAEEPNLTIGAVAGDSQDLLFNVEGAHVLANGRVVVANRSTDELRYYDVSGDYLFSGGRTGEGPGEFGHIAWTAYCGEYIYAYDISNARMSVYDEDGQHQRDYRVVAPNGIPLYGSGSCRQDGTFLMMGWYYADTGPQLGVYRPSHPVFIVDSIGTVLLSYGDFPGPDRWGNESGSAPLPFGRSTVHVLGTSLAYVGTGDTYDIVGLDSAGTVRRIIRKLTPSLDLTDEDIEAYESPLLARASSENARRQMRRWFQEMEYPETVPAYDRFVLDPGGHLWVADYSGPNDESVSWSIFDPSGRQVARAETGASLHVLEIGNDYVLGVTRDELDVEYVRRHQLFKHR